MMQNGGNYAKFKLVPPQLSTLWGENVGKIYSTWNPDDIKLPWPLVKMISEFRSRLCQYEVFGNAFQRKLVHYPPLSIISKKMHKFRYLGDYDYAYKAGLLDILVDVSSEFTQFYRKHGIEAQYVPWGIPTGSSWYQNLNLERDIDALWMGKWRTKKRGKQLVNIQAALQKLGLNVYWADGVSQPFVYGEERTRLLNRAKITLNLGPTWYDPGFQFRFVLAAATIP